MTLLKGEERRNFDDTREQPWGENRIVRDRHEESLVTARHSGSGALVRIR